MKRFLRMTSLPLPTLQLHKNVQAYERWLRPIHIPVLFKRLNSTCPPQKRMRESWRSTEKRRKPFLVNLSAVRAQRKELLCIYRSIREIKYRSDVLCTLIIAVFETSLCRLQILALGLSVPTGPRLHFIPSGSEPRAVVPRRLTSCFNRPIQTQKLPSEKAKDHLHSLTKYSTAGWASRRF